MGNEVIANMIISIHQPNYLPWCGYFYKIANSDIFVMLDNVKYSKNSFINRNQIKTPQGELWLTVPVRSEALSNLLIKDTQISDKDNWRKKHLRTLEMSYKRAKFFDQIYNKIEKIYYKTDWDNLCMLNISLLEMALDELNLKTKLIRASDLDVEGKSTQLLINIIKQLGGSTYLSGYGGKKYQEENLFEESGIKLKYYDFVSPIYPQLWGDFIPNLSVIDLLFNCCPESMDILMRV
jgi:hypothetical protein